MYERNVYGDGFVSVSLIPYEYKVALCTYHYSIKAARGDIEIAFVPYDV